MTKHRTLKAVGFFAVLAVALAFLALPNSQAGAKKPIRWKAAFVNFADTNLTGSGEFVGGVDHVNINNGFGTNDTPCNLAGDSGRYSYIELQVFNPSLQFFNMGGFLSSGNDDLCLDGRCYGFPYTETTWPFCVADFLNNNNPHPTAEYPLIILRFTTCGCGNFATDLMAMKDGDILPVHMLLQFFSHTWGCPPNSPFTQKTFLNLMMNAHGWNPLRLGGDFDVKIQRTTENGLLTWTAYVDTVFDNQEYQSLDFDSTSANFPATTSDNILGQYATCDSTKALKGNKTIWTTTYHYPWAKAPLKFQIKFWKY
ncbi:MAG: hypothetical protein A2028_02565 [Candidatus Aminicenantes bacterium RBG_19FT_COMBO_59_29]|nr:MAG: hypothetical protein A2028_02565 [Candidatus Aminicenantes bacterium RBG_19FT_COMBO_59_29]